MANDYRLTEINLIEAEASTGLRLREHRVWSLFEADRKLEEIRDISDRSECLVQFSIHYLLGKRPLSYKGVFRYADKSGSISLQRHIEDFLNQHAANPEALKISADAFVRLHQNMRALFEACATEQMFKINRKSVFVSS